MELEVAIREYKPKDMNGVLELVEEHYSEFAEENQKSIDIEVELGVNFYKYNYLEKESRHDVFVVLDNKNIVGYAICSPFTGLPEMSIPDKSLITRRMSPENYYVEFIFVSKTHRKKGILKKMYKELVNHAKNKNYKMFYAYVVKSNKPALKAGISAGVQKEDLGIMQEFSLKLR